MLKKLPTRSERLRVERAHSRALRGDPGSHARSVLPAQFWQLNRIAVQLATSMWALHNPLGSCKLVVHTIHEAVC